MPDATRAGETLHAFWFSFPPASEKVTPALIALVTAVSSALETPPPRLMLATAGRIRLRRTQSTPAMTPEFEPEPLQYSTRTGCSVTVSATPYVVPPIVPATCV